MIGSVKYQNFLTDENLRFCQKIAAEKGLDVVAVNVNTKNGVAFFKNKQNIYVADENLQLVPFWIGGKIVYTILNQGEPVPVKLINEYRQAKGELLKALEEQQ